MANAGFFRGDMPAIIASSIHVMLKGAVEVSRIAALTEEKR